MSTFKLAQNAPKWNLFPMPTVVMRRQSSRMPDANRGLRIAMAGVVILLLCPLMAMIAVAIRLESPGPVLVRNSRTGAYLFRTTTAHGGHVTRLGSLLQQSDLYKLPQLISWIIDKG